MQNSPAPDALCTSGAGLYRFGRFAEAGSGGRPRGAALPDGMVCRWPGPVKGGCRCSALPRGLPLGGLLASDLVKELPLLLGHGLQ